ncbi:MAG: CcmD family protein [Pirellulaceae bacterium]|jgi:CcmD family protein|nr:CcmD family protein [Pirellulaceae bacterium]
MGSVLACYVIVWLAVVAYVARLGMQQARLQQRLERLQSQMAAEHPTQPSLPRAA